VKSSRVRIFQEKPSTILFACCLVAAAGVVPAAAPAADDDPLFSGQRFAAGTGPFSVAIGDLNSDGTPDLAVANSVSGDVTVLLGAGDGTFGPQERFGAGNGPLVVAIGDLDGDGALDLAVANRFSDDVSVLLNQCPPCPADLNGDHKVDSGDLGLLLIIWGPFNSTSDLNGDNKVDGADLGLLLLGWGPCP